MWQPEKHDLENCTRRYNQTEADWLLTFSVKELCKKVERILFPRSVGEQMEEFGFPIEKAIVARLRKWSGQDVGMYAHTHPAIQGFGGRGARHLQEISWVICSNPSVHAYVADAAKLETPEAQLFKVYVLLQCNREIIQLPSARMRGQLEIAALMVRFGLDKLVTDPWDEPTC